ncbi:MAG TPA: alanine dehydrogenase [Bacteroidales bacterium]|nr:alanine dehydrogenase [Bacteroidales bacterium]HRX97684.1 alanine dehydrogenase [Bacteroidales bacterium]
MNAEHNGFLKFSEGEQLLPQEETLDIHVNPKNITIGVPAETSFQECRLPLVPQAVGLLVANGHQVIIENDAGKSAHFSNKDFTEVGARVVYSTEEVFKADIILKVAPLSDSEIEMLSSRQTILSSLHITGQNRHYFEKLMNKRMTALAFEFIKDKTGSFPLIRSMSELVGTASIFIANSYLKDPAYGKGIIMGGFPGITPTEVVIIGAGTVAEYSARAAIGVGATVKVFDNSIYKLRRLQDAINNRIFTSILQPKVLQKALTTADVVIGAIHSREGMSPVVVTEDMVKNMKEGSVIIDVSIDQGGCIETSEITNHNKPVYQKHGVTHYCVPNIASSIPHTASYAFSNFFTPILLRIGEVGGIENMLKLDYGLRQGAYLFNGMLTKSYIGEYFTLPYQDIELLIAAFR